jgi:hypothetical protein
MNHDQGGSEKVPSGSEFNSRVIDSTGERYPAECEDGRSGSEGHSGVQKGFEGGERG